MKHPDQETWLDYLYEEQLAPERKADLEAHLTACPDCRRRFESWQAVRHRLNAWSLPAHRSRPTAGVPWLRLAAMLLLLAVGVVLGRYALGAQSAAELLRVQPRHGSRTPHREPRRATGSRGLLGGLWGAVLVAGAVPAVAAGADG